jgi:hypothetical protein
MKKIILTGLLASAMQLTVCSTYSQDAASNEYQSYQDDDYYQTDKVSYQTFYNDLSQYGQWINYPNYGSVWQPAVASDFRPYATNGHWVYSDMGWTWSSDFEWGWAAFHYGRWFYDGNYGWLWVPGYDWAPAWVSWRSNASYYGWAPLMPNISIDACFSSYRPPVNYWSFVPNQYISSASVYNYYISSNRYTAIINSTTIINNRYTSNNRIFAAGPGSREVEQFTHTTIHPIALNANNPQGMRINNDQLHIFRPRLSNTVVQSAPQRANTIHDSRFSSPLEATSTNNMQHFGAAFNARAVVSNRNPNYEINNYAAARSESAANLNRTFGVKERQDVFQHQVQQRSRVSALNESRNTFQPRVSTMPVERPSVSPFRQAQPVQQRMTSRPAPTANRTFSPAGKRNFNRR